MVAQEILVLFVEVRILLSQQKSHKSHIVSRIRKSDIQNGTETGQQSHSMETLYEVLSELVELATNIVLR